MTPFPGRPAEHVGHPLPLGQRQSECLQPGEQRGPASAKRGAEVAQRRRRGGELWLHRSHASLLEKGVKRVVTTCGLTPSSSSSGIAVLAQVGPDAPICDDEHPNILRLPLRLVVGFLRQPVVIWQIRLPPVLCEAAEQRSDECLAVELLVVQRDRCGSVRSHVYVVNASRASKLRGLESGAWGLSRVLWKRYTLR